MLLKIKFGQRDPMVLGDFSKSDNVEDVRSSAAEILKLPDPSKLRLLYGGKFLEDGQRLLNYRLETGTTIVVMSSGPEISKCGPSRDRNEASNGEPERKKDVVVLVPAESKFFDIGQAVDVRDEDGAWHEAKVEKICKTETADAENTEENNLDKDGLIYFCRYDRFPKDDAEELPLIRVRPRAFERVNIKALGDKSGDENISKARYLVNYNIEKPGELGDWYEADLHLDGKERKTRKPSVMATVFAGNFPDVAAIPDCRITKLDEIYVLRERFPKQTDNQTGVLTSITDPARLLRSIIDCRICYDNPTVKPTCRSCACVVCKSGGDSDKLMLCEQCCEAYHFFCLDPPLADVPDDDWYCPDCKIDDNEIVRPGETKKLMTSKLLNMPSATAKRRWGGKNSCDGLTKKCTIVPTNHFGLVPGVEVGTNWRLQKQVAEAGIHRMLVAGIHGKEGEGAYSIIVAGGYSDDVDEGDQIVYTGSGGRDLSGNKRVANQSENQKLTRLNLALARNCYSKDGKINQKGGDAGANWKKGNPLRVVRSHKLRNKFAPSEGYRYDGIYKVKSYKPEKGKEGFIVWRYELARDDPTPAPWTTKGKQLIKEKGLGVVIEPENKGENKHGSEETASNASGSSGPKAKRPKLLGYEIPSDVMKLIKADVVNSQLWSECITEAGNGTSAFIEKVAESFKCIICVEIVHRPITLECGHTFCKVCVDMSIKAKQSTCSTCRQPMGEEVNINEHLSTALLKLIPGYEKGRVGTNRKSRASK